MTVSKPIKLLMFAALSGLSGALSGYYAALNTPVPAAIAIVDLKALVMEAVDKQQAQSEADAKALTVRLKAATERLVEQGVIVLDGQYVLSAPREAYVVID
jgi:hypothetical protein